MKATTTPRASYSMKASTIYPLRPLTEQQLRIVRLVGEGASYAAIGKDLRPSRPYSAGVVRQYVQKIALILQSEREAAPRMKVAAYAALLAVRAEMAAD